MAKKRLEDALQKVDHSVQVEYRCYELDPSMERDVTYNKPENLARKYNIGLEEAKAKCDQMAQMAAEDGLDFQLDTQILTNTFDAHRLTMFAKEQGVMPEMMERILHAHYTESKHIGDHETLMELAEEVGLNRQTVEELLASDAMSDAVRTDEQEATNLGIQSIPYFLINKKYKITGAQPTDLFVQAMEQVMEQDGPFTP